MSKISSNMSTFTTLGPQSPPTQENVKLNDAGEKTSGYFGAAINGYNSQVLEGMCPGLGQWTETIVKGFGLKASKVVKFMVYEAGRGLFPLHNDEPHVLNKFRVSISFSPEMPNFAMRFKNTKNVFEIQRGIGPVLGPGQFWARQFFR